MQRAGVVDDLEEGISRGRAALELCAPQHLDRATSYHDLACDLQRRNRLSFTVPLWNYVPVDIAIAVHRSITVPSVSQIDMIIEGMLPTSKTVVYGRAALKLSLPDHPDRGVPLFILAHALRKRSQKQPVQACDLNEAIALSLAALDLSPSVYARQSSLLHLFTTCPPDRYDNQKDKEVFVSDEVISLRRVTPELHPPGHANRGESLRGFACDTRRALVLRPEGHPDRSSTITELVDCLSSRRNKLGDVANLEDSILLGRADLNRCPLEHANRSIFLHNLGCDLRKRFTQEAVICDLEESIELLRLALELHPTSHPDRSLTLYELALCLSNRYDKLGALHDLEEAIALGRAALDLCGPEDPKRRGVLYDLACYLPKRFQEQADIPKLASIDFHHQAVSVDHPTNRTEVASSLLELSQHLWHRFQKQSLVTDLDDAICLAKYALELRLPREDISVEIWLRGNLCALAKYHRARFQTLDTITDLSMAITSYRYVSQLWPTGHPNRGSWLHDFAHCLADPFRRQLSAIDLDEAIALEQEVLPLLVSDDLGYDVSRRSLITKIA
ncbi:hypothetical protein EDC04DRAFT_2971598 [Pisolithus marmoratus]|nr:hypothetical protein EDC04DRAFT_2971598 [Pisolithus marmoratus]